MSRRAASETYSVKLKNVTWCLGDTNTAKYGVLWCDKQKRAKRNKPSKKNGVMYHEIAGAVEHVYYMPVQ